MSTAINTPIDDCSKVFLESSRRRGQVNGLESHRPRRAGSSLLRLLLSTASVRQGLIIGKSFNGVRLCQSCISTFPSGRYCVPNWTLLLSQSDVYTVANERGSMTVSNEFPRYLQPRIAEAGILAVDPCACDPRFALVSTNNSTRTARRNTMTRRRCRQPSSCSSSAQASQPWPASIHSRCRH